MKRKFRASALIALSATGFISIVAPSNCGSANVATSARSLQLLHDGKLAAAINWQMKELKSNKSNWRAHAIMSYLRYQSGDLIQSVLEGREAATLAPTNEAVHLNLGYIALGTGDYNDAIPAFSRAAEIAPDDIEPWIGLVHAHVRKDDVAAAKELLQKMAQKQSTDFNWFYKVSEAFLLVQDPLPAIAAADKATSLANTPAQKAASQEIQFLANLRGGKIGEAHKLWVPAFSNLELKGEVGKEIYVLAAANLLSNNEPKMVDLLMSSAKTNLSSKEDSETFFRLGRIFVRKAAEKSGDQTVFNAWLLRAQNAYERAIELDKDDEIFHLSLASVLQQLNDNAKAKSEYLLCDKADLLAKFLAAKIASAKNEVSLSRVTFEVGGISCACKIPRIVSSLQQTPGVVFDAVQRVKPYSGVILIDESMTAAADALKNCESNAFEKAPDGYPPAPPITLSISAHEKNLSAADAIRVCLDSRSGIADHFEHNFVDEPPKLPITSMGF